MLNKMIGTNCNFDFADVNRIHPQKEKRVYWGLADPREWRILVHPLKLDITGKPGRTHEEDSGTLT